MHLEFGVTQKPVVMQSLKQSKLYEFNFAKNACASRLPEAHQHGWHRSCPWLLKCLIHVDPCLNVFAHQVFPTDFEQWFSISFDLKTLTAFLRHGADPCHHQFKAGGDGCSLQLGRFRLAMTLCWWAKGMPTPPHPTCVTAPIALSGPPVTPEPQKR